MKSTAQLTSYEVSKAIIGIPVFKRVAILGAGVMGAQIAAHFTNAGIPSLLFDLPKEGMDKSAIAKQAIKSLMKQKPEPLAVATNASRITPCNYDDDLEKLIDCDLVIEAIAEKMEWKSDLYHKISPHLGEDTILASNTSGLSISELAESLPDNLRNRFLGIHFFNPPRYMPLVELIAQPQTSPEVVDTIESFCVATLGKGVVRARDTVNFIANRLGLFSMMSTFHHAQRLSLNFETVDALTGKSIGRPKSATLRTADLVGLDTMRHVLRNAAEHLGDDPWVSIYRIPDWLDTLVEKGALGAKTKAGVYKKQNGEILVYEPADDSYRKRKVRIPGKVEKVLKDYKNPERLAKLSTINDPHAEFLWSIQRDVFHYAAYLLDSIADNAREVDLAIRWGFGWKQGPFEIWQHAGWQRIADLIQQDIDAGKTLTGEPLPAWVNNIEAIHTSKGSWSPTDNSYHPRSRLPVYQRQRRPERLVGEQAAQHEVLFENDSARFWLIDGDIGVLSFKTKMHTIDDGVLDSLNQAAELAQQQLTGMVIWQPDEPFSAGADLKSFMPVAMKSILPGSNALDNLLQKFQHSCIRMRKSNIPVVAGVQGLALGGGCELMMQCDRVVAALESYIGLVEVGVGLIPAGSGCMELARRASVKAAGGDRFEALKDIFETVAMGKVATSAEQAKAFGFLRESDIVVMNRHEVLHAAIAQVRALSAANYRPAIESPIRAGGRAAIANFKAAMTNMHAGGFISDYDMKIGTLVAHALCGGPVDAGTELPESWYLRYEREGFRSLLKSPKTHARVKHMLDTGKPLRN
ncbi:MAG: 3-hydroxyacyl-CoA dehydrogenase/enoyl-CoA hydratase family protein [Candidatus Thiodiazotropha sp. (ex. Lucinisca nassula)]|nr:3-hydroxyacyl-CoA dehydrogenase/enoyl-CoA hydratase family protein [Candidatus Thiodiazotropha sp. (ex. Lucinisca nassula)]